MKGAVFPLPFLHLMKKSIFVKIADIPFELRLRDERIEAYYRHFACPPEDGAIPIEVSDEHMALYKGESLAAGEVAWHYMLICDRLIDFGKLVFHGCAFEWQGKAFIFAAPSGTGKTTQILLWQKLFGSEISILNGDKPILDLSSDRVLVRPSPWRGKEKMGHLSEAPLGGIIFLAQAQENRIERCAPNKVAQDVFEQLMFSAPDEESVFKASSLCEKLLNAVPVWELQNLGDEASAILCHDRLLEEM